MTLKISRYFPVVELVLLSPVPAERHTQQSSLPMQAGAMPSPPVNGYPEPSSQNPTPYQPPDPSTSPSTSTHPVRPSPQPIYPTLNYPQQNGWMYPPNYYPSQPRYNNQPYHSPGYGQMGGPGPGTIQNGYGGYQPDFPPHLRQPSYGPRQGYHSPSDPYAAVDGEPPKPGITIENPFPQQPLPPPIQDGYPGNTPYPMPNGHTSPPGPQSPYQTFYPPDHPYAHGGGFGYPQYPPGPGMYASAYGGYPTGPSPVMMPPPPPMGKRLNPAAQGFNFTPQSRLSSNGDSGPSKPEYLPVFASIQAQPTPAPNGHAEPVRQTWTGPVMVDGEKLKGIGERRMSGVSQDGGSLGLTQLVEALTPQETLPAPPPAITSNAPTDSATTPAMSTSPTTPVLVQTPRAPTDGINSIPLSPNPAGTAQPQPDSQWNFVGPSMSGYLSPPPSATVATFSQAPSFSQALSIPSTPSAPRPRKAVVTDPGPLKLRSSRQKANSTAENAYNSLLSGAIPNSVKTEQTAGSDTPKKQMPRGKGKASGKKVVFAAGVDDEEMARMGIERRMGDLVFGSVKDASALAVSTSGIAPAEATPRAKPPAKPTSWAALVGGAAKPFSRTASTPSSMVVSPSKSVISLATESEAGPSHQSTEPTTPRSIAPSLPPSTGASIASAPRPVFNYAAAAAAGANMSPQAALAKVLTDGLRGRSGHAPRCLPRGLVNTGNMCFANTVSDQFDSELNSRSSKSWCTALPSPSCSRSSASG